MIHERQSRLNVGTEGEEGTRMTPGFLQRDRQAGWWLRQEKQEKEQFGRWNADLGLSFGHVLLGFGLASVWSVGAEQGKMGGERRRGGRSREPILGSMDILLSAQMAVRGAW